MTNPGPRPIFDSENQQMKDPHGSIAPHLLLIGIQILGLISPRFSRRNGLMVVAILCLATLSQCNRFTNDLATANLFSLAWPHYLSTLVSFMLATSPAGPEYDLWRMDREAREAIALKAFSWAKLRWALGQLVNLRGVRWNYQVKNVPRLDASVACSRTRYLLSLLVDVVWVVLMADLIAQMNIRLFFTSSTGIVGKMNSKYLTIRDPDPLRSLSKSFVYGAGPYFFINMQYMVCAFVAVLSGLSQPEDWPPLFGHLSEVTTVRYFWGNFWHQMIRRVLNSLTERAARALGIAKGTNLSSYFQLWLAFTISGLMHAASLLLMPSPKNITWYEQSGGVFIFFISQAAAITTEDFVQWLTRRVTGSDEPGRWKTLVGYMWVTVVFWQTLPFAGDTMLRMKMGQESPLPFSIFSGLVSAIPVTV